MKQLKKYGMIALCIALMLPMASCEDFLTELPAANLSPDGYGLYETPVKADQGIVGVYSRLRFMSSDEYLWLSEARSDNMYLDLASPLRDFIQVCIWQNDVNLGYFNTAWVNWYQVIYNANLALDNIPSGTFKDEALKNQFLGEARFLRGWAYFELVRLFGNVPIVDKVMLFSEVNKIKQSSAADVYAKMVIPDLIEAKKLLPLPEDMKDGKGASIAGKGRADRIAATAMLGRAYMTMAGFPLNDAAKKDLAKAELKEVLDYAGYPISASTKYWTPNLYEWRNQWISEVSITNKYSIFAIQHRSGGTGNPLIFNTSRAWPDSYTSIRVYDDMWIHVDKYLSHEYDIVYPGTGEKDGRGWGYSLDSANWDKAGQAWVLADMRPLRDTIHINGVEYNSQFNAYFYKFMNSKPKRSALGYNADIEGAMSDYNDWPVNFPIIRLEDVALMYAEIVGGNEATDIVNAIRTRAHCDPVASATLDDIKRERRVELMGEGIRFFDMVRWNEWEAATKDKFKSYAHLWPNAVPSADNVSAGRYLCPIPSSQLQVKPGLYEQNPGYLK